jgi:hypothetical protein
MKKMNCLSKILGSALALIVAGSISYADNPIVQTVYTADPAPLVHNNTFYVYAGHDEDSAGSWFYMRDWRCFSSTDMANWTDLGTPLSINTFSWAASDAWAAHCIFRDGRFYFYATVKPQNSAGWAIGVAVADRPEGPFTDAIGGPLVSHPSCCYIDPTVFIDDGGQAYLYWGNPGLYMVRLNSNMTSYTGSITEVPQNATTVGNMYAEAPWFYERNGTYYMVFATDDTGNQAVAYSTSTGPTGPWTFRGKIMNPSGTSWTLHPGVVDYKGNSYLVYHNGALPGGNAFHRSVAIDRFVYNANGTIPMIAATSSGPPQLGTLDPYFRTEAETICWESGLETEVCNEGGMNVSLIENGDYIKVKGVNFGTGATSFEARVASAAGGGNIEIRLGSVTGPVVGTCSVAGTGGWQNWVTRTCPISGASGLHDLYLRFTGGGGFLFNFNWWRFSGSSGGPIANGTYRIIARHSLKAMDAAGPGTTNGTQIHQWTYLGGNNQRWTVNNRGSSQYSIIGVQSGRGIDINNASTANGAKVQLWDYWGGNMQKFTFTATSSGYYRVTPVHATGSCLDVAGVSAADGALVHLWTYGGGNNQQWAFQAP